MRDTKEEQTATVLLGRRQVGVRRTKKLLKYSGHFGFAALHI